MLMLLGCIGAPGALLGAIHINVHYYYYYYYYYNPQRLLLSFPQDVTNLEEAKQILIGQKLEAQNAMGGLEERVKAAQGELEHLRADSGRVAEMLRAENSTLQDRQVGGGSLASQIFVKIFFFFFQGFL